MVELYNIRRNLFRIIICHKYFRMYVTYKLTIIPTRIYSVEFLLLKLVISRAQNFLP